jgi:Kef-type K+ transport system membrane component KefB
VADYIWNDPKISLLSALAMTATAVSLTMVSLRSEGLQNSAVATRIMTSAVIDDIAALVAVAVMIPVVTGSQSLSLAAIVATGGKAVMFFVIVTVIGAWLFPQRHSGWVSRVPLLGRYGVKHILTFDEGRHATLAILSCALVVGLIAVYFGFHSAVGAYMAGLIVREEYFQVGEQEGIRETPQAGGVYEETKRIVNSAAFSWIGPVFFVDLGAKLVLDTNLLLQVLPYALLLTTALLLVQVASAGLAARYTGNMSWHQSLMIGFGMLGRAELAFVVMDIGYVQNKILSTEAFFTLMITAFFLNIAVPLSISWWRPYYQAAEAARKI